MKRSSITKKQLREFGFLIGFGMPIRDWFRNELKDWLYDILSKEKLQSRGIFNPTAVTNLVNLNSTGTIDASYTLLSIVCIEIWCQKFLDNKISVSYTHLTLPTNREV